MIGADEFTLCNEHGSVIIIRRNREKIDAYRAEIERLNIPMDISPDEIRNRVWASGYRG